MSTTAWHLKSDAFNGLLGDLLQDACDVCGDDVNPGDLRCVGHKVKVVKARRVAIGVMLDKIYMRKARDSEGRPSRSLYWVPRNIKGNVQPIGRELLGYYFGCHHANIVASVKHLPELKTEIDEAKRRMVERYPQPLSAWVCRGAEPVYVS